MLEYLTKIKHWLDEKDEDKEPVPNYIWYFAFGLGITTITMYVGDFIVGVLGL